MWYQDIRLILAPMAGFTDQPFRRLCRRFGADEVVTELLSANAIVRDNITTLQMAELHPDEKPASVQIFGSDPDVMAEAASKVEQTGCSFIDINMGCPVRKVVKNGGGSALLGNPILAAKIVRKVVDAVNIPVSVKLRTGKNSRSKTGFEIVLACADSGASRLTIHARTVSEGFSGPLDYDFVAEVRKRVTVEVIGNGGIKSLEEAKIWIDRTGVEGLMIGRGAIGHPSFFKSIHDGQEHALIEELDTVMLHCRWMEEHYGPDRALGPMRGHLIYYSKGFDTARKFRKEINRVKTFEELKEIVYGFFTRELENAA